jgi:hypothetical protein
MRISMVFRVSLVAALEGFMLRVRGNDCARRRRRRAGCSLVGAVRSGKFLLESR